MLQKNHVIIINNTTLKQKNIKLFNYFVLFARFAIVIRVFSLILLLDLINISLVFLQQIKDVTRVLLLRPLHKHQLAISPLLLFLMLSRALFLAFSSSLSLKEQLSLVLTQLQPKSHKQWCWIREKEIQAYSSLLPNQGPSSLSKLFNYSVKSFISSHFQVLVGSNYFPSAQEAKNL